MESIRYRQGHSTNQSCGRSSGMYQPTPPPHAFDVDCNKFPIGMGYVPMQKWGELYSLEKGLCEGTIFVELNQYFCGKRGSRA